MIYLFANMYLPKRVDYCDFFAAVAIGYPAIIAKRNYTEQIFPFKLLCKILQHIVLFQTLCSLSSTVDCWDVIVFDDCPTVMANRLHDNKPQPSNCCVNISIFYHCKVEVVSGLLCFCDPLNNSSCSFYLNPLENKFLFYAVLETLPWLIAVLLFTVHKSYCCHPCNY